MSWKNTPPAFSLTFRYFFRSSDQPPVSVNDEVYHLSSHLKPLLWSDTVCMEMVLFRPICACVHTCLCGWYRWNVCVCVTAFYLPSQILWSRAVWLWQADGPPWHSVTDAPAPWACAARATLPISLRQTTPALPPPTPQLSAPFLSVL